MDDSFNLGDLEFPQHPGAYTARDIVALWDALGGMGKEAVVKHALDVLKQGRAKGDGSISFSCEEFCATSRWPITKWRKKAGGGRFESDTKTIAGVDHLLRTASCHPFLKDECILWRVPLDYGHFAVGGRTRRIVLIGIAATTHYNGLVGPIRARLEQLISQPPEGTAAWVGEFCEPQWCDTDRWLDERGAT